MSQLDPRLAWKPRHDPRSRNYPVRALLPERVSPQARMWAEGPALDQGREGACVGFGWTGELLAAPKGRAKRLVDVEAANAYASGWYRGAKVRDEWPGEDYEGTSVLAGAQEGVARGLYDSYRWAFSPEDVRDAVLTLGPVVIGIPWYSGMYDTRASGLVEVSGSVVGGHCVVVTGYHPAMRLVSEPSSKRYNVFRFLNSWGLFGYGRRGHGYLQWDDFAALQQQDGEACIPTGRHAPPEMKA